MGVSSEREGPTGPGQHGTDGVRDVRPVDERDPTTRPRPSRRPGAVEENPDGIPPKAGYSSKDPRSD